MGGWNKSHHLTLPKKKLYHGNSLAVQWLELGLGVFTARTLVQALVRELRSHEPLGAAKNKKEHKKLYSDGGRGVTQPKSTCFPPLLLSGSSHPHLSPVLIQQPVKSPGFHFCYPPTHPTPYPPNPVLTQRSQQIFLKTHSLTF